MANMAQSRFLALNVFASLLIALLHVLLFWMIAWYLYRHGIVEVTRSYYRGDSYDFVAELST